MEAVARPLRRLQQELAWFARAGEVRLLYVTTDASLRGMAVDLAMAHENHADNRGIFFQLDDAMMGPDQGWPARVQRLKDQLAEKTRAVAPAGIHLKALPALRRTSPAGHISGVEFASVLRGMAAVLVPPLTNLVVVMAPVRVETPERFAGDMSALIASPELSHVRWIVVETDGQALAPVADHLGEAALSCSCVVDDGAALDDLAALGAASVNDTVAINPRRGSWRASGAAPDVEPPARPGQPPVPSDAQLVAAGMSSKFVNGGGEALQRLVLGAALAVRQKQLADAVTLQSRAAALCGEMTMPREQILNLHILAGYLVAAAKRERARDTYSKARDLARNHGLVDAESQSELALGMMEAVDQRYAEAATHYSSAGRLAEVANVEPLAIECWRMAGQLAVDAKLESTAVECWRRALTLAGALEPGLAKITSAPEVARALAAVCRTRGLIAQAQSLEQRSVEMEQEALGPVAPTGTASS